MARSLGSIYWMMPSELPEGVPGCNYIIPHGVLEIKVVNAVDADPFLKNRSSSSVPKKYQLMISGKGFDGPQEIDTKRIAHTLFHRTSDDHGPNVVVFNDKFSFATETKPYCDETIQFLLLEPGLASAKKEKGQFQVQPFVYCLCCLCIPCVLVYKFLELLFFGLLRGATLTADAIVKSTGSGSTLAFSEGIKIPKSVWEGKVVTIKVPLYHKDDYGIRGNKVRQTNIFVQLKWEKFNHNKSSKKICSSVAQPSASAIQLPIRRNEKKCEEFSGYEICKREGLDDSLRFIESKYDKDTYGPRSRSALEPPPINSIYSIYGINQPTEVGCVYSRQDICISDRLLRSCYIPDAKATIEKNSGYKVKAGIIQETPKTKQKIFGDIQVSGDGTVPYWSLAHCKSWRSDEREVKVTEIDKAEHREILADPRFHEALLNYVCVDEHSN